jgi:uncharacterized protein (TIGR00255 family)
MTLSSMTGFARAEGAEGGASWAWEIKTVNSRSLDMRFRLPPGLDRLEPPARTALMAKLKRGNVSANLSLRRTEREPKLKLNRAALDDTLAIVNQLRRELNAPPPQVEELLRIKGVISEIEEEEDEGARERLDRALLIGFERALDALETSRAAEGTKLAAIVTQLTEEIAVLAKAAASAAAGRPEAIAKRMREQIAELMGSVPGPSEERLAQEIALIVARGDVREELDRLGAHVAAARELVTQGSAVGRRLDFLCQELNREANTLCSKASDLELTRIGLDLKAAIERLREQVQNIE